MCRDGRFVSVYLSLLLSCSVQEPEEKRKCVSKICSSIDFPFEAWNTSQDLKPNNNPVLAVTMGFLALWNLHWTAGHLGQSTHIIFRVFWGSQIQILAFQLSFELAFKAVKSILNKPGKRMVRSV